MARRGAKARRGGERGGGRARFFVAARVSSRALPSPLGWIIAVKRMRSSPEHFETVRCTETPRNCELCAKGSSRPGAYLYMAAAQSRTVWAVSKGLQVKIFI